MSVQASISVLVFLGVALGVWLLLRGTQVAWEQYHGAFTHAARTQLSDLFLFIDPQKLFYLNLLALALMVGLLWWLTGNLALTLLLAAAIAILPRFGYRWLKARRLARFESQLPDALMMLAGALRAGASLRTAIEGMVREQAAPLSQEFDLMLREQRVGLDFDTSLNHMAQRLPLTDFQLVVAALRISREVGGNLAETLAALAETLRRKQMMEGKIKALTAQGKMQGVIMAALPVAIAGVLFWIEPEIMSTLFTTRLGWGVLAAAFIMELLGYLMIRKILRIDV